MKNYSNSGCHFFCSFQRKKRILTLSGTPSEHFFSAVHKSIKKLALYAANISRNNVPIEMIEGLLDPYH